MKNKEKYLNTKIAHLTIKKFITPRKVEVVCDCGTVKTCDFQDLKRGRIKGCGCQLNNPEKIKMTKIIFKRLQAEGKMKTGGIHLVDEDTPFRYINKLIKSRGSYLSIDDLKLQWSRQNGICPFTHLQLILPTHSHYKEEKSFYYASVDRIDPRRGYEIGNIQFVSRNINYMKQSMSQKDFICFLGYIKDNSLISPKTYTENNMWYFLYLMRRRDQKISVSKEDLFQIWTKQEGKCIYSNIPLVLYIKEKKNNLQDFRRASIDRIDSSLPYSKDNIQFVSKYINFGKNSLSDQDFKEFLSYV